jgi:hypothetical protein
METLAAHFESAYNATLIGRARCPANGKESSTGPSHRSRPFAGFSSLGK